MRHKFYVTHSLTMLACIVCSGLILSSCALLKKPPATDDLSSDIAQTHIALSSESLPSENLSAEEPPQDFETELASIEDNPLDDKAGEAEPVLPAYLGHLKVESASPTGEETPELFTVENFADALIIRPSTDLDSSPIDQTSADNANSAGAHNDAKASGHDKDILDRIRRGLKLDLDIDNPRIQAQVDWYTRNQEYLDRAFNRSARYLYHVVNEIEKRKLPMELALLPFVESAYDPFAYSHGRASGLWQFIPGTGRMYGLHQNWWYDGRRDVLASTKSALDYLDYLNRLFDGDWLHALASYNSGSGRVSKAVANNKAKKKGTDFWSLDLPKETRAYVPILLALSKIVKDPARYGVTLPEIPNQPYFAVVNIQSQLDLAQAATLAEIDVNEIYLLNPGYNQWATDPLGPHRLLIPVAQARTFENNLKDLPPESRLSWSRYTVKRGDSIARIARDHHTTPAVIKDINHLKSDFLKEKQTLLIPTSSKNKQFYDLSASNRLADKQSQFKGKEGSSRITYIVKAGDTFWDLARKHKVGLRELAKWNGMAPTDPLRPGKELLIWSNLDTREAQPVIRPIINERQMIRRIGYQVRKGDSLARIAQKFSVSVNDLVAWNKLDKRKHLQPGQKLTIFVDITNT